MAGRFTTSGLYRFATSGLSASETGISASLSGRTYYGTVISLLKCSLDEFSFFGWTNIAKHSCIPVEAVRLVGLLDGAEEGVSGELISST